MDTLLIKILIFFKSNGIINPSDYQLINLIDPYIVYKYNNENDDDNNNKTCALLTLNDLYLVEKDETNSNLTNINELSHLSSIQFNNEIIIFTLNKKHEQLEQKTEKLKYKFETNQDLNNFIDILSSTLFNEINLKKCELFFCIWCRQFLTKSKFNEINDDEINNFENLTCTKCNRYLIKDKQIQQAQINETTPNKTEHLSLSQVLKNLKEETLIETTNQPPNNNDISPLSPPSIELQSQSPASSSLSSSIIIEDEINKILANNKLITKSKLDEINNECKRINNNLKLYLIINVLNQDNIIEEEEEEDLPICYFKLENVLIHQSKSIENCLCIFSKKNIYLFKILNEDLFNENIDFDKCLRTELVIKLNKIETIEVGIGHNYLIIETNETTSLFIKFFTMNIYKTSSFRNNLLKILNESNNLLALKNSKKTNQSTILNLIRLLKENDFVQASASDNDLEVNLFTFIDDIRINEQELVTNNEFKYGIYELYLHSNECLILLEENLEHFQIGNNKQQQFKLVDTVKLSDIVQLKLFKQEETKLEISIVDETKNKNISWLINFRKQPHMLSQLIELLKQTWESIYGIELPINY